MQMEQADKDRALAKAREALESTSSEDILANWAQDIAGTRIPTRKKLQSEDEPVRNEGRREFFSSIIPDLEQALQNGDIERMRSLAAKEEQSLTYSERLKQKGFKAALQTLGIEIPVPPEAHPLAEAAAPQANNDPQQTGWKRVFSGKLFGHRREV